METPATKWQPIATAPRDTPILVTDGEVVVSGEWGKLYEGCDTDFLDPIGLSGYEWKWSFDERELAHGMPTPPLLTHWMPLPPLPDEQDEQRAE